VPAAGDGAAGGTAPPAAGDGGTLRALTVVTDPDHDLRPQIFRAVADAGGTIYEMVTERTSMEDIFHQLTGSDPAGTEAQPATPVGTEAGGGAGAAAGTKEVADV
nr:hypothetical protein [Spirochaeta sp.]